MAVDPKNYQYRILKALSPVDLVTRVKEATREDGDPIWEPIGGLAVHGSEFYQAMIRRDTAATPSIGSKLLKAQNALDYLIGRTPAFKAGSQSAEARKQDSAVATIKEIFDLIKTRNI